MTPPHINNRASGDVREASALYYKVQQLKKNCYLLCPSTRIASTNNIQTKKIVIKDHKSYKKLNL